MAALNVALSAVILMAGLLIASALMAVETGTPVPHAQMNRPLYATIVITPPAPAPVAQMNRASYRK